MLPLPPAPRARPAPLSPTAAFAACLLAWSFSACGGSEGSTTEAPTGPPATGPAATAPAATCNVTGLSISPAQGTLVAGDTLQLAASVTQTGCSGEAPTWQSGNRAVVSVSPAGTLTALAPGGPVTVTARYGAMTSAGYFTVLARVASVGLSPGVASLQPGQAQRFVAVVRDAAGAELLDRPVTWTSSNNNVATVSGDGLASAVTAGQAVITATCEGRSASATVTVAAPTAAAAVATVAVAPAALALTVGQTGTLTATLRDAQGTALTGRAVAWATSNAGVVSVSGGGVATAVAAGQATVTATSEGRTGSATVTVSAPPARQVTLAVTNELLYPINIAVGGATLGSVPAQSTRSATVDATATMRVTWTLVQPTVSGRSLGDPMSGSFDLTSPSGTVPLTVDNLVGSQPYFVPAVTNNTGVALLMAVNWGLAAENRCNCTAPANGAATGLGYYRLYSNSTLAAFRSGTNYTGNYRILSGLGASVTRGSGRLSLTFNTAP